MVWSEYEDGLDERLLALHGRVHSGAYRALPSRRVAIPKPDGGKRPLGIAALEDKIVQKAVVDVILTPIYEPEFLGFSYRFRPGRGAHVASARGVVGAEPTPPLSPVRFPLPWFVSCPRRGSRERGGP